jgi:hypothetical protein
MAVAYNLYGGSYDIRTPEETIRGTATIQGKFNVVSNGKTVTLTNPSKATLKYYIQTYGDVTHVGSNQKVAYGSDELFHFVEVPKQIPYNPPVTPDIPTNDGNVCEYWDLPCHAQQGLDWVWGGAVQGVESYQDIIDKEVQIHTDNYNIFMSDAQKEFETRLNDVRNAGQKTAKDLQDSLDSAWATGERNVKDLQDSFDDAWATGEQKFKDLQDSFDDAAAKAAKDLQDALDAAAKAAADAAAAAGEGATKGISDTLKIAGVAALGLGVLLVMKK